MTNNNADDPRDANPSGDVTGEYTAPPQTPRDAHSDEPTLLDGASPVDYNPLPASRADTARQQRALRRMSRQRDAPSWVKKIPWILFPVYGFMRLHDPDYEEHYEQWREQERRNYDQREPE